MKKIAVIAAILVAGSVVYLALDRTGVLEMVMDAQYLAGEIRQAGLWGPATVIGLMVLAVVMSPLPSAPIAMATGAVFGVFWGTIYVVTGAEIGAMIAFGLARNLGRETMQRWFGEKLEVGLAGSQSWLMAMVFFSRLAPFISFDLVSYAAGLTALSFWRFVLATLLGILPTSYLLAFFGEEAFSGGPFWFLFISAVLGAMTVSGILYHVYKSRRGSPGEEP
ncbi:MAG: TVP38/TMEM64 family protein [Alphaproteobacteria bacterium]